MHLSRKRGAKKAVEKPLFSPAYVVSSDNISRMKREFVFWKDYFLAFFKSLDEDSRSKVLWMLKTIESLPKIPSKFFKHIEGTNGLFELRISWEGKAYRIFCFFDKGNKIILCNGFIKKDQKTPKQEIIKAIKIKEEYRYENEK